MGEAKRRSAEIAELKKTGVAERAIGFSGGLQAAAIAMRRVLSRKLAVGILTEETAKAILEDTGKEIDAAIDRAFAQEGAPSPQ